MGGHLRKDGKVAKKKLWKYQGKSKTCNTARSALYGMQVINTNSFNTYYAIPCKSQLVIYILECILFNLQYVGKSGASFNMRLNWCEQPTSYPSLHSF